LAVTGVQALVQVFAEPTCLCLLGRGSHEHERGYGDSGEQDLAHCMSSSIALFSLKGELVQLEDNCLHLLDARLNLPCATCGVVRAFAYKTTYQGKLDGEAVDAS
jgi:hypothetical protein